MLTAEQKELAFVAVAYVGIIAIWVLTLKVRADGLIRAVGERIDAELWNELGAPSSWKEAINDDQGRWMSFVRSGDYRRCNIDVVDLIDDFRRRTYYMLALLAVAGALIAYRYWHLLAPALF